MCLMGGISSRQIGCLPDRLFILKRQTYNIKRSMCLFKYVWILCALFFPTYNSNCNLLQVSSYMVYECLLFYEWGERVRKAK